MYSLDEKMSGGAMEHCDMFHNSVTEHNGPQRKLLMLGEASDSTLKQMTSTCLIWLSLSSKSSSTPFD